MDAESSTQKPNTKDANQTNDLQITAAQPICHSHQTCAQISSPMANKASTSYQTVAQKNGLQAKQNVSELNQASMLLYAKTPVTTPVTLSQIDC